MLKVIDKLSSAWPAGIANVCAMLLQLKTVVDAHSAAGLSRGMLVLFILIQLVFSRVGYQNKIWGQCWMMGASAVVTVAILCLTFVY